MALKSMGHWSALYRGDVRFKQKNLELDMKNRDYPPVKPYIEEAPKEELKALSPHLRYVFLGKGDTFPVIIASDFNMHQVESLVEVLKGSKELLGGLSWRLLESLSGFVHIKSNSCPIICQVLSTRDF